MGQEKVLYAVDKGGGMMTREEAIAYIREWLKDEYALNYKDKEALNKAIEALAKINKIKEIIAIDNLVIQEDVMKYKMICEVLE